jgi:hypothetical protein
LGLNVGPLRADIPLVGPAGRRVSLFPPSSLTIAPDAKFAFLDMFEFKVVASRAETSFMLRFSNVVKVTAGFGLVAGAALVGLAGPAAAAGILPPANPSANVAATAAPCVAGPTPDSGSACISGALAQVNAARAAEGVGPMILPDNFSQLTLPEQQFVVIDLERVGRGLPAVTGLTGQLDGVAGQGAGAGQDPPLPTVGDTWAGSIWAGGLSSTLQADFEWMYSDGLGSTNLDCTTATPSGCWGHRDIILAHPAGENLVAGAANNPGSYGAEYAMVFVQYRTPPTSFVYTWNDALAHGAAGGAALPTATPPSTPPAAAPVATAAAAPAARAATPTAVPAHATTPTPATPARPATGSSLSATGPASSRTATATPAPASALATAPRLPASTPAGTGTQTGLPHVGGPALEAVAVAMLALATFGALQMGRRRVTAIA